MAISRYTSSVNNSKPIISLILARADNGVIGKNGGLPWRLPADLQHFKRLTVGKPIIMGRKTFDSLGRPLPGRHNIVVTRQVGWQSAGVTRVPNIAEAIAAAGLELKVRAAEIMIIGGADIYSQCLLFADRVYLTEVHIEADGDTLFPAFDSGVWGEISREDQDAADDKPAYSFVVLERLG